MSTSPPAPQPKSWQEELAASGDELVARVKQLVQEGNVRRVTIRHEGCTIFELPLAIGVVGALLAPQLAALGAVAALITECTITVERADSGPTDAGGSVTPPDVPPGVE